MSFSEVQNNVDDEFCRDCGITTTWTGESWVHDTEPDESHDPIVPWDPYELEA